MAAVKVEAQAERNGESVPLALCAVCGQPTAEWVVAQNAQVIQDLNEELMARGRRIRTLEADNNTLTTENELLNKELMRPDHGGDEDGVWGFILLLLAIVVSFALGWVMSSAVGV
jgi:molybdopterin converting factor small subunit